jgi:hypothetical protein
VGSECAGNRTSPIADRGGQHHGQTWIASEAARTLDISQPTTSRYLDLLTDANVVRQLQPSCANVKKLQVRSPRVYVRDNGLLHRLLGITMLKELLERSNTGLKSTTPSSHCVDAQHISGGRRCRLRLRPRRPQGSDRESAVAHSPAPCHATRLPVLSM